MFKGHSIDCALHQGQRTQHHQTQLHCHGFYAKRRAVIFNYSNTRPSQGSALPSQIKWISYSPSRFEPRMWQWQHTNLSWHAAKNRYCTCWHGRELSYSNLTVSYFSVSRFLGFFSVCFVLLGFSASRLVRWFLGFSVCRFLGCWSRF